MYPCLSCNASYIGETVATDRPICGNGGTDGTAEIRFKYSFKIGELKSKIVVHAIETDHWGNFDYLKFLISIINN